MSATAVHSLYALISHHSKLQFGLGGNHFFFFFGSEDVQFVNGVEGSKFKCQKLTHLAWHEARQ